MVLSSVEVWQEYRVNMGNFEHVVIGGRMVVDLDTAAGETNMDAAVEAAQQRLEDGLFEQLKQAREHTAENDSFVHEWGDTSAKAVSPPSQRRRR
jgi:hypothetical protein